MSNTTVRILTALVGIPLVLGVTYLGGWPFGLLVLAAALVAQHEYYGLMAAGGLHPARTAGLLLGALVALRAFWAPALPLTAAGILLLIAATPFQREGETAPASLAATVFGIFYPTAFLTALVDLRLGEGLFLEDTQAFLLTLAVFLLIWSTDTFAYFVGRAVGRRPLAPRVSPKKTWEGTVGGAVGALVVAVVLRLTLLDFLAWPHVLVVAFICGIVSQLGDLAESKMKRAVGVKDSGTLLPGHGGLLDRFDAMILAAPLVYLYLAYGAVLF